MIMRNAKHIDENSVTNCTGSCQYDIFRNPIYTRVCKWIPSTRSFSNVFGSICRVWYFSSLLNGCIPFKYDEDHRELTYNLLVFLIWRFSIPLWFWYFCLDGVRGSRCVHEHKEQMNDVFVNNDFPNFWIWIPIGMEMSWYQFAVHQLSKLKLQLAPVAYFTKEPGYLAVCRSKQVQLRSTLKLNFDVQVWRC